MLNPQQDEAVRTHGHCLVTACPGSGKTRVLSSRAKHLLTHHPGNILLVTFTRDAANELQNRTIREAGHEYSRRIGSGTFHALALKQLTRANIRLRMASDRDRAIMLKQVLSELEDAPWSIEEAMTLIDEIKCVEDSHHLKDEAISKLYQAYIERMEEAGASDFADIINLAVEGMRNGTIKPYSARWMLVDEAQDKDEMQLLWVLEHIKHGTEVTLVGDEDQAIYGFRGSLGYSGMQRFQKECNATTIPLPLNYRCAPDILEPAARLIAVNKDRSDKPIIAASQKEGDVQVLVFASLVQEANAVLAGVQEHPEKWAVLARNNRQLDAVELALDAAEIPYYRAEKGFWSGREPSVYLSLLKSVIDGSMIGIHSALQWAGVPNGTITQYEPMFPIKLAQMNDEQVKNNASLEAMSKLARMFMGWQSQISDKPSLVLDGIEAWMIHYTKEDKHQKIEWASAAIQRKSGSIAQRIANLQRDTTKEVKEGVGLLTLHKSKGLEFPHVWMIGCEDGNIPNPKTELEEERRLFYVGMTRAEEVLVISSSDEAGKPSPFIKEAGLSA